MSEQIVTVFGATGKQGGSVVRALLGGGVYKVRAVTRNPQGEAAQILAQLGAEVVFGDLDDGDSVLEAVTGACGCFGVTDYWAHMNKEREVQQGRNIADACKEAEVSHLVYSGIENIKKIIGLDVPHCDGKGDVEDYITSLGIPFTSVRLAAYTENFLTYFVPQKTDEGKYAFLIPMADLKLPLITCADVGECVHQVFKRREEFLGRFLGLSNYEMTIAEISYVFSKCLGKDFVDSKITTEAYSQLGFPGAEDLANMFVYYRSGKCFRDMQLTNQLNPKMATLQEWLNANKETILKTLQS